MEDIFESFDELYYEDSTVVEEETPAESTEEATEEAEGTETVEEVADEQPWKNDYNANMAAERRRREQEEAIRQAKDSVYAEVFKGQPNPYNGNAITSERDYLDYQNSLRNEQLKNVGLDENWLNEQVNNHPAVKQAEQLLQEQNAQRGQQLLNDAIKTINQFDADIKTFEDLYKSDHFQEINQMVQRGYSLTDAYKLANIDKLTQKKTASAKQQALNSITSKSHMQPIGGNGEGEDSYVPESVYELYKEMNPNATDAEIRKHYAKITKG